MDIEKIYKALISILEEKYQVNITYSLEKAW